MARGRLRGPLGSPRGPRITCYSVSTSIGHGENRPGEAVGTSPEPVTVPARIQAEDYAAMSGLVLEDCGDEGGGLNLGYFDPGDTFEYRIRVEEAGEYVLDYRLASQTGSPGFEILVADRLVDTRSVPDTGGWQTYVTRSSPSVALEAGEHVLRIRPIGTHWNLNWIQLRR